MFDWTFCCTVVVSLTSSCCYRSCYTIVISSSSKGKFQSLFGFSTLILFSNWLALVYVAKFDIKVYKEPPSFGTAFVGYALHCYVALMDCQNRATLACIIIIIIIIFLCLSLYCVSI